MAKSAQQFWLQLSWDHRLGMGGSILAIIGAFLPWYSDLDLLRTGDVFSGVTGPLYFLGYSLVVLALASLAMNLGSILNFSLFGKRIKALPVGKTQMILASISMYLIIAINTVFFSPQFGLNILSKQAQFGSAVSMAGTLGMLVGGYLHFRKSRLHARAVAKQAEVPQETVEITVQTIPERAHAGVETKTTERTMTKTPEKSKTDAAKYYDNMKLMMERDSRRASPGASGEKSLQDKVVPNSWYRPGK